MSQILNLAGFGCVLEHSSGCKDGEVAAGFSGWGFSTSLQSCALNKERKWSVFGGQTAVRGKQFLVDIMALWGQMHRLLGKGPGRCA